jgi:hypothetical protein
MIYYIPRYIKISSGIQMLIEGFTDTQTAWRWHKPTLISADIWQHLPVVALLTGEAL